MAWRLEGLNRKGEWTVWHKGAELKDPARYLDKLTSAGNVIRLTDLDTDEVLMATCSACGDNHTEGECLL